MIQEIYEAIVAHWNSLSVPASGGIHQAYPIDLGDPFVVVRQVPGGATATRSTCTTTDMYLFSLTAYYCRTFGQCDGIMEAIVDGFENAALTVNGTRVVECVRQRPPFIEQDEKTHWVGSVVLQVTVERSF